VYPYPDKKRRDKLRSRIYAHAKEYLDTYRQLGMADEFGDVVNLVHGQFMEDFKKDGVDLGKEHRKPYRGAKAVDPACRNHGSCLYCESNRLHKIKKQEPIIEEVNNYHEESNDLVCQK